MPYALRLRTFLCFLFLFYNFYRIQKQRQKRAGGSGNLFKVELSHFLWQIKVHTLSGQAAVACTGIWTGSLFLLRKGHRWRAAGWYWQWGETHLAEQALRMSWPPPSLNTQPPPRHGQLRASEHLVPGKSSGSVSKSPSFAYFFPFKSLECSTSPNNKERHLIFHFKRPHLRILSVLKKALCWSPLILQSFPVDEYLLVPRWFLRALRIGSRAERPALPLEASYSAPLSLHFFLCKKEIILSSLRHFRTKQGNTWS